jgi:hypothetical protein
MRNITAMQPRMKTIGTMGARNIQGPAAQLYHHTAFLPDVEQGQPSGDARSRVDANQAVGAALKPR